MDIKMPVLGGKEATAQLKAQPQTRDIPIVAVTASVLAHLADDVKPLCDGFLRKPVLKADLLKEMTGFLKYECSETRDSQMPGTSEIIGSGATDPGDDRAQDAKPETDDADAKEQRTRMNESLRAKPPGLIAKPPELNTKLAELLPEWELISQTRPIHRIQNFADRVAALGQSHEFEPAVEWARESGFAAENFDVERIVSILVRYRTLV